MRTALTWAALAALVAGLSACDVVYETARNENLKACDKYLDHEQYAQCRQANAQTYNQYSAARDKALAASAPR